MDDTKAFNADRKGESTAPSPKTPSDEENIQHLRDSWDAGMVSGTAGEVDMSKLRDDARKRLDHTIGASVERSQND